MRASAQEEGIPTAHITNRNACHGATESQSHSECIGGELGANLQSQSPQVRERGADWTERWVSARKGAC